jgi:lysozyme family protein
MVLFSLIKQFLSHRRAIRMASDTDTYTRAIKYTLQFEGGFSNHPSDPGGKTNYGITQVAYDTYRKANKLSKNDVRNIQMFEVHAIYRKNYWEAMSCDALRPKTALALFDLGVNVGTTRAIKLLQSLVAVPQTGKMTTATIEATRKVSDLEFSLEICAEREKFYHRLIANRPKLGVFKNGWYNRTAKLRAIVKNF